MVIIMDMTSGKNETAIANDEAVRAAAAYAEDVMLAGWTALPSEFAKMAPAVLPRLAEVAVEASAIGDADEFLHRVYAAQGLPGRRR